MVRTISKDSPIASEGQHRAHPLIKETRPYGYYIYTPPGYNKNNEKKYPLIVFLHGVNERGNSARNPQAIHILLQDGLTRLIHKKKWNPSYPALVVSPQCHHSMGWKPALVHELILQMTELYTIDNSRIYITGFSMGGYGTLNYLGTYGKEGLAAAAVPICAGGNPAIAKRILHVPIWAFHGEADNIIPSILSIRMIATINHYKPDVEARLTLYPGIKHDSWTMTYDGSGMGKEDKNTTPFNQSIFDWMFQYQRKV